MRPKKNEKVDPTNKEHLDNLNHPAVIELFEDLELVEEYIKINSDWRTRIALLKLRDVINSWIPY